MDLVSRSNMPFDSYRRNFSRFTISIMVVILLIVALVLMVNVNSLEWPIGARLAKNNSNSSGSPSLSGNLFGTLYFEAKRETVVSDQCASCLSSLNLTLIPSGVILPYSGLLVGIGRPGLTPVYNVTDSNGVFMDTLLAGQYIALVNATGQVVSIPIQIQRGIVTHLSVLLNSTLYPTEFYDFFDENGAGEIGSWQNVVVEIASNSQIAVNSSFVTIESIFSNNAFENSSWSCSLSPESTTISGTVTSTISSGYSNYQSSTTAIIMHCPQTEMSQAQIVGESFYSGTLWLDLRPTSYMSSSGVVAMNIVVNSLNYTVSLG
jgi:hypothetical protein